MPTKLESYQCRGCKKLIPANARYLKVAQFSAQQQAAEDDNDYKKTRQINVTCSDEAFCDEQCLSDFVLGGLKFIA